MAIGALTAARAAGRRCPANVSIMGFDDIRYAQYLDPALTTVSQPMVEIGRATVDLLLAILRGEASEAVSLTLPHAIVVRASSGPAPAWA